MNTKTRTENGERTNSGRIGLWFFRVVLDLTHGFAVLITGSNGEKLRPCYIRVDDSYRLVAMEEGYLQIVASQSPYVDGDGCNVRIERARSIDSASRQVEFELVSTWDGRRWHGEEPSGLVAQAAEIAKQRAKGSDAIYWIPRKSDLLGKNL